MKILLGLIAILSIALVPAPAETAKERAHEKVVAEAPRPTAPNNSPPNRLISPTPASKLHWPE